MKNLMWWRGWGKSTEEKGVERKGWGEAVRRNGWGERELRMERKGLGGRRVGPEGD